MTRKRGRPSADRRRNLFVYLLVAELMDLGLCREEAAKIASSFLTPIKINGVHVPNTAAFDEKYVRKVLPSTLKPSGRTWKPGVSPFTFDALDGPIELHEGIRVWLVWEEAWRKRADFGVRDSGVPLSPSMVERIYDRLAAEVTPVNTTICPGCGHKNLHSPTRDQVFFWGDMCRRCGAGTGVLFHPTLTPGDS